MGVVSRAGIRTTTPRRTMRSMPRMMPPKMRIMAKTSNDLFKAARR